MPTILARKDRSKKAQPILSMRNAILLLLLISLLADCASRSANIASGSVVGNMVATSDDRLYLACSGVNKVAIVEAKN